MFDNNTLLQSLLVHISTVKEQDMGAPGQEDHKSQQSCESEHPNYSILLDANPAAHCWIKYCAHYASG